MASYSKRPGMGAIVSSKTITFRVWAPHAVKVFVVGPFNKWKPLEEDELVSEGNGFWSADIAAARTGDEYRFQIENGDTFTRIDPFSRSVTSSAGNSIVYDSDAYQWKSRLKPVPPENAVIYELHIGTFRVSGKGKSRHGTFADAAQRLPYLKELGITTIEVMPVHEFPGDFSWGYNPAHLFAVESGYGGPDEFKSFIDAAHELGLAVLLDVVYNHLGPNDCGVWQFDGWSENDMGGVYFYQDERSETPWTKSGRPDYGRNEVRQYLRDNAVMWLSEFRIDGLRFDSVSHIRNIHGNNDSPKDDLPDGWSLLQWIAEETSRLSPHKLLIAEDLNGNETITDPTAGGGLGFDSQWDKSFADAIRGVLICIKDEDRDMNAVTSAVERCYSGNAFSRVIYTESHDEADVDGGRLPTDISPTKAAGYAARKRALLGAVLTLTSPGIPMLLQGQEFLEKSYFDSDHQLNWGQFEKQKGIFAAFQDLIALRTNQSGETRGLTGQSVRCYHVNHDAKMVAYVRSDPGHRGDTVVVINFKNDLVRNYRIGLPAAGIWHVRFDSDNERYGADFGGRPQQKVTAKGDEADGLPYSAEIVVGPYSAVILSKDS